MQIKKKALGAVALSFSALASEVALTQVANADVIRGDEVIAGNFKPLENQVGNDSYRITYTITNDSTGKTYKMTDSVKDNTTKAAYDYIINHETDFYDSHTSGLDKGEPIYFPDVVYDADEPHMAGPFIVKSYKVSKSAQTSNGKTQYGAHFDIHVSNEKPYNKTLVKMVNDKGVLLDELSYPSSELAISLARAALSNHTKIPYIAIVGPNTIDKHDVTNLSSELVTYNGPEISSEQTSYIFGSPIKNGDVIKTFTVTVKSLDTDKELPIDERVIPNKVTKPVETKPVETKPVETKPVETKPVDTKPVETKPVETKPVETKPVETKPVETKPVETKPVTTKPVETKPAITNYNVTVKITDDATGKVIGTKTLTGTGDDKYTEVRSQQVNAFNAYLKNGKYEGLPVSLIENDNGYNYTYRPTGTVYQPVSSNSSEGTRQSGNVITKTATLDLHVTSKPTPAQSEVIEVVSKDGSLLKTLTPQDLGGKSVAEVVGSVRDGLGNNIIPNTTVTSTDKPVYVTTNGTTVKTWKFILTQGNITTPVETKPVETKPVETKPVETKPVETKPVETKPVETKPVDTKPVETKPVETKPVETKPVETKPVETKPTETKPVDTKPTETKPVETKPVDTKPVETKPVETKPVETKPVETKPVETKPTETKPVETKPVETKPVETKPVDTKPVETKPVETKPVDTKPVETKPVETKPVETKPVETKPVETKPVETKPVETKPVETKPVETKPVETKPVDIKPVETKPLETKVDAKSTDAKSTDVKSTDAKTTDAKSTDAKTTDAKSTDVKSTYTKSADAKSTDAKSTKPIAPESLPKTGDGGSILSYLGSSSIISGLAALIKRRKK